MSPARSPPRRRSADTPVGPGKYDDACTAAMTATGAEAIVLVVIDGDRGNGFSVQSHNLANAMRLPRLLRDVADGIEADLRRGWL